MKTRINLLTNVKNDGRTTVERRSTDGQSQRHYTLGLMKYAAMITLLLTLACGNVWGAVTYHSIVPNIDKTNYETYYLFSNGAAASSTNVVGTAFSSSKLTYTTACSSWVEGNPAGKDNSGSPGDFSAQGFYKTDAGDLKYNGTSMTFHVTNCVGVALLGKGNSNTKPLQISVKEKDSSSEVGSVASTTGNSVMVLTYGTTLNASKKYDITITSVSGGNSYAYQIRFEAPDGGVTNPSFSPATGSSLVKSAGTVTLTSSGNTVYYKWSQTDNQYASGAGSTLAGAADGSGSSPVNATAPSTTGTWYLYAVAKNGGDYSNVVKTTYTITNPTYTVSYNLNGGKYNGSDDAPTQEAVESGTNITMPVLAPTKADYAFVGWRCSVNSADYMPSASYTMTAANTTFTAQWAAACFEVPDARKNSNPAATITASMLKGNKIAGGTLTWESASDYSGNGDHGLILNEDGEQIVVTLSEGTFVAGSIITITTHGNSGTSKTCGVKVSGNNMTPATYSTESTGYRPFSQTYVVQAGDGIVGTNTFAIKRYNSNQVYIYSITVSGCGAPSCTAPNHVDISGAWDRFGGETISLTATAYSSEGTGSPIADGNITGWQWQKLVGSTWTDVSNGTESGAVTTGATTANLQITNCIASNSGKYRCVVSTGATCSTASATATDGTQGLGVKVFMLECYNDGTKTCSFTRTGDTQTGTATLTLAANTAYTFKFHVDNVYYGNNASINEDITNYVFCNSDNGGNCESNFTINSGLGGTFTLGIDYSTGGNSSVLGEPELSVTYPRKTIYLTPGVWNTAGAKFAFYYFRDGGSSGWTDLLTNNDCGMSAEIPQWNGVKINAVRLSDDATVGTWDKKWNQTSDITVNSNNSVVITDWGSGDSPHTYGTYSIPTYTIEYAKGSVPTGGGSISGSKSNETKTCGVDFTLPSSAVFTTTGYTQTGWTTSDGGAQEYALGGTYTTNEDKTFYPVWTVNNYDLTWNLGGGTTTSAGTGIASGVSSNTTTSQAFGTALSAPTVTKTGYNFSAWSPAVASTMPAANTTYTATWTEKTTTITIDANSGNHGSTTPGNVTATYGSALPSFTAAAGVSGWNLTGYFTAPTSGTKVINADGTLVASTSYADGSGNWKYESATLTLYPQYEEEGCSPTTASITFNNNVAGKFNTNWSASDITTSGGATYTLTNTSCDTGHKMTKQAIKGAKNSTLIQINIPAGATSGTISVSAATYEGGAATLAITNSGGSVLASQSLSGTTTNPDAGSWSAPTLKTASYNITSGGTYYIKETSNSNNIYIYAFSATGTIPCCNATPDAPTSPSNGATGSTTQAVSWTDAGNDKWEVYVSTSSSTPGGSQTPTASPTTASYTFEDLTASTQYYWWVRSVCDADHKSSWVAGTSFTTSAPAVLTAMECNTLYKVADMVPASITLTGEGQYGAGLSTNTKFEVLGDPSKTDQAGGAPEMKNISSVTIDGTSFGAAMYLKRAAEISSSLPTSHAVKFIVSESAKLIMYVKRSDRLYLIKEGGSAQSLGSSDSNEKVEKDVTAGTYYIYANNTNTVVYGLNLQCCTTPADPDGLAAGSITGTTATFTITDDETPASYDIYYSTSSTAPTSGTAATTTTTTTSKLVEGLTPNTTYYAWVRAVCDASHKSDWVALTGTTFATLAAYDVDFTLTNVSYSSGDNEGTNAATSGVAFSTVFAASSGYSLPGTITVTIGGETATVSTDYTWNQGTGALTILAASVTDDISVTIVGEELEGDGCEDLVNVEAATATTLTVNVGSATVNNPSSQSKNSKAIKLNSSGYIELSPKAGKSFAVGDSLIVVVYNQATSGKTTGFKIGSDTYTASIAKESNHTFRQKLTGDNIVSSKVKIERESSDGWFVSAIIKHCEDLPSCTTPTLPSLSDQTVCPGSDIAAWDATATNAATITAASEDITYSWKKKGSDTELAATASFDLGSSATEGMAGTYVVTVTVSKTGYISKSASAEVDLTVTPATETPSVTASKAKVYATDEVTLTATCGSTGVTWNWYLCANSDGTGAGSSLGTSSTYTIASAPAAGTYYYKAVATGDGTHSCGAAEYVYTLVVSAANSCDKEFWFAKEGDRPTGAAAATHITGCPSGSSSASYTASIDGTNYTLTGSTGQKTGDVTIVVPADNTGTLYVVVQGSSSRTITLSKGGTQIGQETPANSTWGVFTFDDLDAGTYTLVSSGNISWAMMALKLCPTVACTDDTPTAAATNATVCAGGTITITATGYEAGANFQWQKQNASTSVWENIDGATSDTYTVTTAAAEHAGNYHIVATKNCARTSNTVTIAVPSAPVFNSFTTTRRIMETQALAINDVSATDAVSYTWYKSADATWDAGDEEIGTSKNLLKPYAGETAGSTYYVFCHAVNSCGTTTSSAITVNVQTLVEEDCAIVGNSGEHNTFAKTGSVSSGTYGSITELHTNSNNKYIYYTAESGYYFATATVNACVGNASDLPTAAYSYSTDGGANWTDQNLTGMTAAYADHVINLPANVNAFRVGRRLGDCGTSSNTIYIHEVCFTYNENCTKTTVDPSSSSESYEIGDSFTEPTFTVKSSGIALSPQPTITYTSSDETVATVDDDGSVNFQDKAGTVVITASYAGDATYCSSEGSYTITVSCSDEAPRIIAAEGTNLGGCNDNITLEAKKQDGTTNFSDGTYQWYRDGEAISGATGRTYTVSLTGVYSVERTSVGGCVSPSSNKATVSSESAEPEVERLTPFQYYHVDKVYAETSIMRFRHLFAVKNAGTTLEGKHFKMELSRNGGAATDVTNSNAFVMSADTVLLDLNKMYDKYEEDDELVLTCSAVDCEGNVSSIYKNTITIYVIDETPTLALICSGANGDGTRSTKNLVVGGDFLTGYNKADLCVQTGNTSFDKTQEWVLYTRLKENYIVTPVNGYAEFNKLNYEPFDILFLTDYPKASKSDAAATILDDMADLCDYRPLFTFKTHMVAKSPSKWAAKGFMAQPEVPKQSRLRLNIVCYAHPMFADLKETSDHIQKDAGDHSQIVYTMLAGAGHEGGKGMQGFPIDAAEGFVTIGLVHYDATATDDTPSDGYVTWTPGSNDVMMVAAAERQVNVEARMILFSVNCGAQSMLTETGRQVVLKSLEYLLSDATITPVADCSFTFTNGVGNTWTYEQYKAACPACTGTIGDGKWSTAGNWGPDWVLQPGKDTEVKIAAPVTVDMLHAKARAVRIIEGGSINIPAGSGLEVGSTIRRQDGTEISPTEVSDVTVGTSTTGNGTLILNNNAEDTKATVWTYSKGFISEGVKNYQYIGTPFSEVNALYNYYGSWIYSWGTKKNGDLGWVAVKNGGPMHAWTGYCISQEAPTYYETRGTLTATNTVDIAVPAGNNMVVGNSWTAPIDINAFTNDDFENLTRNVYFFNTGVDKKGEGTVNSSPTGDTRWAGGTYVSVPIHAAPYTDDNHIPSLQGFFVKNEGVSAGTLHLDYERHVRNTTRDNILSGELHAPARRTALSSDEPVVLKMKVSGENYDDKLLLLAREDFTTGFDNGWDGDKWDGNESALYIYTTDNNGTENSVSAIPQLEGTVIGFRAGEDDAYTLHFEYLNSDEPLYLYDVENNTYTQIMTGMTYRFFTTDNEKHARFIITRSNGQEVATGVESTSGSLDRSKAKKLLIEDKMFIIVNGMLYDATGKVVK